MTYNWNTMVEITVPTGTNGWLYSGEVIINGVKVRFPVGVPTSVPEPAAVLLKKMIELEQEEDANTAKPQNHYVGDVTIPAGKTLTLEKGSKLVDNSGPSEVVILPETVATVDDGSALITTPLSATPTDGATAKVTYNGTEYICTIVRTEDDGVEIFGMGNTGAMGLPGGNADAPFVVMLVPAGQEGMYGTVEPMDDATTITLSIVQTEGAASGGDAGGGVFIVKPVNIEQGNMSNVLFSYDADLDKPFEEAVAAFQSGRQVVLEATNLMGTDETMQIPLVAVSDAVSYFTAFVGGVVIVGEYSEYLRIHGTSIV